jgi:hypothetical protein
MPIATIPNWGLGLNTDAMPSELPPGYCTSCSGWRFPNGYAQTIGNSDPFDVVPTVTPYWIGLYGSATQQFHIHAGTGKVFAADFAGVSAEITRYTDGMEIASITFVGTTATLTTVTPHGLASTNVVTVFAALPTQYNATGAITVTGPTTFTYVMATAPATNATYMGGYSYDVTSNFTGAIDDRWSGGSINGIFFLNNPVNGLYYWNGDLATRLRKMPGSGVYAAVRAFKNYLVWLTVRAVGWSDATEPGAIPLYWASPAAPATAVRDEGYQPLSETQGALVDCLPLGDANIIYGRDSRYVMRYIGGNDVFSFQRMPGNDGVRAVSCVVDTPKGHIFLTQNLDVKIHSGGGCQSLAEGRVRTLLNTMVTAYRQRAFLCVNPPFNEVWVFFNTANASGHADVALLWNWNDDTWGKSGSFLTSGITFAASGLLGTSINKNYMLMTTAVPYILAQDRTGISGAGIYIIERTGLSLGDEDAIKNLSRSKWSIDTDDSGLTVSIQHGSSKFPDTAPTYATNVVYTHGATVWANAVATGGRFLALKATFLTSASGTSRFKNVAIDVSKSGTV